MRSLRKAFSFSSTDSAALRPIKLPHFGQHVRDDRIVCEIGMGEKNQPQEPGWYPEPRETGKKCVILSASTGEEPVTYTANFIGQTGDNCSYQMEERDAGELVRAFLVTISCAQRASAKGWEKNSDERKIELWCTRHSSELPKDGERIQVDLDEVAKD
jgi:hypothetical protein